MPFYFHRRNLFIVGILLIVVTAWFSVGYHHPDEHYQILEFAKYKLGEAPVADLPWEFREEMRPGLQPFLAYCSILAARSFGIDDPFVQVFLMRLLAGLLAFFLYWKWCDALAPSLRDEGRLLRICLVFFWMLPYLNVRFSSENMSAIAFLGGLWLIFPQPSQKSDARLFLGGLLLCLSFFFRYQIAFAGLGLGAWLLFQQKLSIRQWLFILAGAFIALIPALAADYWLYGKWVLAPYNYFAQNIVEDKAAGFGVSPWWWYFTEMPILLLPPISLFLFWFMGVGIRRSTGHVFVWCLIPFVIGHSIIGHKESRFLFPMIFPMFYLAALGWELFWEKRTQPMWLKGLFNFTVVVNMLALIFRCGYPANDLLTYSRFMRSYAEKNPNTTIFWESKGPKKKETLTPHFYQTPWMKIVVTDSLAQLNDSTLYQPQKGDLIYFRTEKTDFVPQGFQTALVYKWYPDWLLSFNPNQWQERTRIWSVYRLE